MAASPNKDRYRRYSSGSYEGQRGGLNIGSLLRNLVTSEEAAAENQPADTAAILGEGGQKQRFLNEKGEPTTQRYRDVRSFGAKAFGQPNEASELNTELMRMRGLFPEELAQQRATGELANELAVSKARELGPVEAYNAALSSVAQRFGVQPTDAARMFPMQVEAMAAQLSAETARNVTAKGVEEAGRPGKIGTAGATAQTAQLTAQDLLSYLQSNPNALRAATASDVLKGPAALQQQLDIMVPPEQTLYRQGEIPELRQLFGRGTITGSTSRETPETMTIGGQQYPTGRTTRTVTPGQNNMRIPIDPSVLGQDLGRFPAESPRPPMSGIPITPQNIATPPRTMPGRSSRGVRMGEDFREEQQKEKGKVKPQVTPEELKMLERLLRRID